jgi:hydrophobe/amphiphile efflux-3 (HAE3) family protein
MHTFSEYLLKYRLMMIMIFILITIGFMSQLPKVAIDTEIKSQLPNDMPSRLDTDQIDTLFGGTELLMVVMQCDDILEANTLTRLQTISKKIKRIKGVDKVLSLFELKSIKGEEGALIVEPAVNRIPENAQEKEQLRTELKANDIVYGNVISKDFTVAAVIAVLASDVRDDKVVADFHTVIEETPGPQKVMIGGLPFIRVEIGKQMRRDMRLLLPVGILLMLLFLYACFRRLRGVLLPFFVVIMSIVISFGFIALMGWKIHLVTLILPILLIAVANDYGIHMIAKYQEDNTAAHDFPPKVLAQRMLQSLGKPILLTGLTTIAGLLCLMGHILVPAKQLGLLSALGIFFALTASLFFIPALISFLPRSKPVMDFSTAEHTKKPVLERLLWYFGELVSEKSKPVIIAALCLVILSTVGIFFVVVDTNPNGYYHKNHPVVQINDIIDQHLGGSQNISLVYQGDIKDPQLVKKIDTMERTMDAMEEVGNTISIARVIRQMSRALHDSGDVMYNKIPDTRRAVSQYFELYNMSGDPADFEKMVDFPYEHAILTARINMTSTVTLNKVVDRLKNMVKNDQDVLLIGGFGVVLSDFAHAVVNGQLLSLFLATILVALLLMLLFRSFVAGVIAAIPLVFSIIVLFGLMGFFNIELNIATAMLSSIMIGVGIDYTIHFLWRYREERRAGLTGVAAVKQTLTTTGRGIIFNALSVIVGFSALFFSSFLPVQFFGFLIVVSISACLIGALVLIPALCLVFRPKFLEPK